MDRPTLTQQGYHGRSLVRAVLAMPPEPMELISGVLNAGWGVMLLIANPFPAATTPRSSFRLMAEIADVLSLGLVWGEVVWALPLVLTGVLVLSGVLWGRAIPVRIGCMALSVAMWTFIWCALALANWRSTGTWIYLLVVVCQFWTLVRLRAASRVRSTGGDA